MIILVKLLLAHLIGDFILQPKSWVDEKEKLKHRSPKLYVHALLHGLLVLLLLWDLKFWLLALLITILHFAIDLIKLYCQNKENKSSWFFIDQALHLVIIFSVVGNIFEARVKLYFLVYKFRYLDIFNRDNFNNRSLCNSCARTYVGMD